MRTPWSIPFALACVAVGLTLAPSIARASDRAYPSADAVQPLRPGSHVPSAPLETVRGESVDIGDLVKKRGALIVFYRGGW